MDLDTYLTTNVLDTFIETLGIRNYHVDDIMVGVGAGVTTSGTAMGQCVAVCMFLALHPLRVHIGYLCLVRSFLMCSSSLSSSTW